MKGKEIRMTSKEYEQRLEALEREIAELRQEAVEEGSGKPPHQRPELKEGDMYYYISADGFVLLKSWFGAPRDYDSRVIGNVFRTKDAAEYAAEYCKVLAEMREWAGNWDDSWVMIYDGWSPKAISIPAPDVTFGELRFATKEDAENCIKAVGKDRLIKYYFGVRDHEIPAEAE